MVLLQVKPQELFLLQQSTNLHPTKLPHSDVSDTEDGLIERRVLSFEVTPSLVSIVLDTVGCPSASGLSSKLDA